MSTVLEDTVPFLALNVQTGQEVKLAMQELMLTGTVLPVGAELRVRHLFRSAEKKPVEVIYCFGLPRDAALRQFRLVGENFSVFSELHPVSEATKIYEEGVSQGSLSALVRSYRDGLVNLSLGNLRPGETVALYLDILAGVELREDGFRFRFSFTLAPCYHAKARVVEPAPDQGEMELPEEFGDVILPTWMREGRNLHAVGFSLRVQVPQGVRQIGSPSHALTVKDEGDEGLTVGLAPERDVPNRDLVLDVQTQEAISGVFGGLDEKGRGYAAVVVPSCRFGRPQQGARRVVFVVDRSSSMGGTPLEQAKRAVQACLGALSHEDMFSLVAFDNEVESLSEQLLPADSSHRKQAQQFLAQIEARGGTELASGLLAAAKLLGPEGGDVLVVTDGQVFGTEDILRQVRARPTRIHVLGIGAASQDRFLTLLARQTGGRSRFLTPRERVDTPTIELFAGIGAPVARHGKAWVVGSSEVRLTPDGPFSVCRGTPWMAFVYAADGAQAVLHLEWENGEGGQQLEIPLGLKPTALAETVRLLEGARRITDLEATLSALPDTSTRKLQREEKRLLAQLERLSKQYGLASRAMALVAVIKRPGDRPDEVPKTQVVPVGMPEDTAFESYFRSSVDFLAEASESSCSASPPLFFLSSSPLDVSDVSSSQSVWMSAWMPFNRSLNQLVGAGSQDRMEEEDISDEALLVELAGRIEPDGGMPGKNEEQRWWTTAAVLCYFLSLGHTPQHGAFRRHVERMLQYLTASPVVATDEQAGDLLHRLQQGDVPSGAWRQLAEEVLQGKPVTSSQLWKAMKGS